MDGVLVDSESQWIGKDHEFHIGVFGKEIGEQIGNTTGISLKTIYEKACDLGTNVSYEEYVVKYNKLVTPIYAQAALTAGVQDLTNYLTSKMFLLGLVSATPRRWIQSVTDRLQISDKLGAVVSINDTLGLHSKPAPDGYLEALRILNADPAHRIVLEDSNLGIASGKAAGCYVIGYSGHLADGYEQTGADEYANTMDEVIDLVEKFDARLE